MSRIRYRHIRKKVKELASKINVPDNLLPYYKYSNGEQSPLIEIDRNGNLHYVLIERGKEFERKTTEDFDELLYWIFSSITAIMSFKYELKNRIENKDVRRIAFKKQIELLSILDETWSKKEYEEHLKIIEKHPFDDLSGLKATYCRELREKGLQEEQIEKLAFEKYQLNEKQDLSKIKIDLEKNEKDKNVQNIVDTFSIFHDGIITKWTGNKTNLTLTIECQYLAKIIDSSFELFFVDLINIEKISFNAWMNPINLPQKVFTEIDQVFQANLEILSAENFGNEVVIDCNQHDTNFDFCGGKLSIKCDDIIIKNQNNNILTIDDLDRISNEYWNNVNDKK